MDLLILAVILFSGAVSAAFKPVSVHYGGEATLSWLLPASAQGKLVRVVNPYSAPVLDWAPNCTVNSSSFYTHRIRLSCKDASQVTFTLVRIKWSDEGPYTCRDGSSGAQVEDCGQNLTIITVPPKVHIEFTSDSVDMKSQRKRLTLTCVVTEALPLVPDNGYSWSYLPSHHEPMQSLAEKTHTLIRDPLTREDSGQYFCQARNDQDNKRNISPGHGSVAFSTTCIDALLRSDISPRAVVKKEGDGYKALFELAHHPGLLRIQHPDNSIIFHWHPPCNFSVTPPFTHRVTNTSCDPCKRTLSFSLSSLTEQDLGRYQCIAEIAYTSKEDSCSVDLKVPIQVHLEPVTPDHVVKGAEGSHLTLTCVVTQAFPPVPKDGYSWSYLPSTHGRARPLVWKTDTLTLDPLTRRDSGHYFCQAKNDLSNRGEIPPGNASVTVDVFFQALEGHAVQASDGNERLLIALVVLVVIVIILVAVVGAVVIYLIRSRRQERIPDRNSRSNDIPMKEFHPQRGQNTSALSHAQDAEGFQQLGQDRTELPSCSRKACNFHDDEDDPLHDNTGAKGPLPTDTTPRADKSSEIDIIGTKTEERERESLLGSIGNTE